MVYVFALVLSRISKGRDSWNLNRVRLFRVKAATFLDFTGSFELETRICLFMTEEVIHWFPQMDSSFGQNLIITHELEGGNSDEKKTPDKGGVNICQVEGASGKRRPAHTRKVIRRPCKESRFWLSRLLTRI
jgi:hypothetical protein